MSLNPSLIGLAGNIACMSGFDQTGREKIPVAVASPRATNFCNCDSSGRKRFGARRACHCGTSSAALV
jgi:hypothetical protein